MWLVVHGMCLTADNLQRRGCPNSTTCQLCQSEDETYAHLFIQCRFTTKVWRKIRSWASTRIPLPGQNFANTEDWWLLARKQVPKVRRRDFDTVVVLAHWRIWKERNSRIFEGAKHSVQEVFQGIRDDIAMWRHAGLIAVPEE
jgi:hypothetical protein